MTARSRFLAGANSPASQTTSSSSSSPPPQTTEAVDSDFLVILAALLCALICVLGLVAVARCAWIRRFSSAVDFTTRPPASANKGLKKKVLKSIPKLIYDDQASAKLSECPICLAEFVAGDEIRVLPQCGHGFHVGCIDTWLGSHSSCPSCRQILVVACCHKCGSLPTAATTAGAGGIHPEPRENHVIGYLP
ncbi:hypothetical protein ACJIZ3_019343 [Penstemon smallii]|uniref:RING-type domain-containing protein n=1 Tax=Penstemon smallii TaxID=265156 RepID=A0ABD3T0W6_9LAMI